MLTSFLGEGVFQQALLLTASAWAGMLLLVFHSDALYRRWPALAVLAAMVAVASVAACTMLLAMMTYSNAAVLGGASLVIGGVSLRVLRRKSARGAAASAPDAVMADHRETARRVG